MYCIFQFKLRIVIPLIATAFCFLPITLAKDFYAPDGAMYIGVDYYPEHWPEQRWAEDLRLMHEAGFNVVRVAEFTWVMLEPEEGRFTFDWLDRFLDLAQQHEIKVILGTPTASMPAWVARKYPETLAMKPDGTRSTWGGRKNNCFSDGTYRLLSERITRAMAEHFRNHPAVAGWQTDNEFGGTDCRCHHCRQSFQDWLRTKYGSLDRLNQAWGTHFWGHTLQRWDEITIPDSREGTWAISNPSASLDWMRFTSWLNVRFQGDQVRILREVCPNHFITHNFMGLFQDMDYYDLARDLDFVSWDNYPVFATMDEPGFAYSPAMAADVMRGLKARNFWIMEQSAGPLGWGSFSRNLRPGELRQIAMQQVAHGADGMLWFRWRTCTAGREQYWHGLLGHDGKAGRRYREAAATAGDLRRLQGALRGTTVEAPVAMLYDYDSLWALRIQPGFPENQYLANLGRYHRAFVRAGVNVDMVPPDADLSGYRLVIASSLHILPDETADRLTDYVRRGGVLLADIRTGVKDATNLAYDRTLPGRLSQVLGVEIPEYEALYKVRYRLRVEEPLKGDFEAAMYADWIEPKGAVALAAYDSWPVQSYAAITRNQYESGKAWYVGTVVPDETFYDQLIGALLSDAGVQPVMTPPAGVEVSVRSGEGRRLLFLINHLENPVNVQVPVEAKSVLDETRTPGEISLPPYGATVLQLVR